MPKFTFEDWKKYRENAENTKEIEDQFTAFAENLSKISRNVTNSTRNNNKNIAPATALSTISSDLFTIVQDPAIIEFEDEHDAEKKSQKKWETAVENIDDLQNIFNNNADDLINNEAFDGPEKVDIEKFLNQLRVFSEMFDLSINTYTLQDKYNTYELKNINNNVNIEDLLEDSDIDIDIKPAADNNIINENKNNNEIIDNNDENINPYSEYIYTRPVERTEAEKAEIRELERTVRFEGKLREFAAGLNAVHWHGGGGVSRELQDVKDALKDYYAYKDNINDPKYEGRDDAYFLNIVAEKARTYTETKRRTGVKNHTGSPDEPQWRPWSNMGSTRFEAALNIDELIKGRLKEIAPPEAKVSNEINRGDDAEFMEIGLENTEITENRLNEKLGLFDDDDEPEQENIINAEPVQENKPEVKDEIKEEVKPEVKEEPKVEVNEEVKPEINEEVKEEPKVEVKEEPKQEVKEEPKPEAKPVAKEQPKNENIINEEPRQETAEEKQARIKKAKRVLRSYNATVGKYVKALVDSYDEDDLDPLNFQKQAAKLIAGNELLDKYKAGMSFGTVEDRFESRVEALMRGNTALSGYTSLISADKENAKKLLKDPKAMREGFDKYNNEYRKYKATQERYGEKSAGSHIAYLKFKLAVGSGDEMDTYYDLVVAQAEAKKVGFDKDLIYPDIDAMHKQMDNDTLKETFGKLTPEEKANLLEQPFLALEMYNKKAAEKGGVEIGSSPEDALKKKSREELKKNAGANAGPTIDQELQKLKKIMKEGGKEYYQSWMLSHDNYKHILQQDLMHYTVLKKISEKIGGGDVPLSAVKEEYDKGYKELWSDTAFRHIEDTLNSYNDTGVFYDYKNDPDSFVEEYDRQTAANNELRENFARYQSGTVGRNIAWEKHLDQKDFKNNRFGTRLTDVLIYHVIGKTMGYDHVVTEAEFKNTHDLFDYGVYLKAKDNLKLKHADQINMMSDPKALDELLNEYNKEALKGREPQPQLYFDKTTMTTRKDDKPNYSEDKKNVLEPVSEDRKVAGDIRRYQNNIREIINDGEPKSEEAFNDAKEIIMKNTAAIIATKVIWPKPSKKTLDEMRDELVLMNDPEYTKTFRENFQKKEDDCNELSNNIYEQRRDFKRMFDKAKDWKSLVDLSKKALGTTGLEITFELKNNKEELEKEDAISQQMQRKNEMNKKPKVMN